MSARWWNLGDKQSDDTTEVRAICSACDVIVACAIIALAIVAIASL